MTVLVVGAGIMGRWVGATLDGPVAFADVDQDAAETAAQRVDGATTAPLEQTGADAAGATTQGERSYDAVVVAVPMTAAPDVIAAQAGRASNAILDVAGEMAGPIEAMRAHAPTLERLSLHPMFAPTNAPGSIAAVHDNPGPITERIRETLTRAGNDLFDTSIDEHDDAMESVQAATHTAILAWRLAAEDVREEFHTPLSAELETLAAHVTAQEPRVYADIAERYGDGTTALAAAANSLAAADRETFLETFEKAAARSSDGQSDDTDGASR